MRRCRYGFWNISLYSVAALSFFIAGPAGAQQQRPESGEVARMRSNDNEYERRDQLQSLFVDHAGKKMTAQEELFLDTVIAGCLEDESPVVVEEAIRGIGLISKKSCEKDLVSLYYTAQNRFGGYAERIRLSIIATLGKIGKHKASKLFRGILAADNGSVTGEHTLSAIKMLEDASLVPALERYAEKMEELAARGAAAGHDPLLYSMQIRNAREARDIIPVLSRSKGE